MKLAALVLVAGLAPPAAERPPALLLAPGEIARVTCQAPSGCVVVAREVLEAALAQAARSCRRDGVGV